MKTILKQLLTILLVGVVFVVLLALTPLLFQAGTRADTPPVYATHEEDDRSAWAQIDTDNPTRVNLEVDYSEGTAAAWFPKGEAPILADLVEQGELPPVEERVGPEPLVMRGVDGIGQYGGTWLRIGNSDSDGLGVMGSRLSYASLLRFSPQGLPVVPHVAKAYEVSDDNRVFTFHLRRGMRWSDGHPFTANDVVYWWEEEIMHEDMGDGMAPSWMTAQGTLPRITAPDEYTLRFEFEHPYGMFLYHMATNKGAAIINVPKHYLERYHPVHGDPDFIAEQVRARRSTSPRSLYNEVKAITNPEHPRLWPWVYRTYRSSGSQNFVRNPYYFAVDPEGNQLPYIDQVFYEPKNADMVTISAAAGGASMQARHIRFEQYTFLMSERENGRYSVFHWYPGDRSAYGVHVNINRKADTDNPAVRQKAALMKEVDFRRALSLAIDRERIITAEYSGMTEPAQIAPGPDSPFYVPEAFNAYTAFDPGTANRLLDELGLGERDFEGYRVFPDGSPLTMYLSYTSFTGSGPALFLVEDWAAVGVRVIARERSRTLFDSEIQGGRHDLAVWIGNGEFFPILEPRQFAPITGASYFAPGYSRWFTMGGLFDNPRALAAPGAIPPPEGSPARRAIDLYMETTSLSDLDELRVKFGELLRLAAQNVWTINVSTPPPVLAVVADNMANVPRDLVYSWDFQSPGNGGPETFYLREDTNTPETREQIASSIIRASVPPSMGGGIDQPAVQASAADRLGGLIRTLFKILLACLVILAAKRHPFIARRLLIMVPTLFIVSIIVFTVIQLPPGDFLRAEIMRLQETGDQAALQRVEELQEVFHLDDPTPVRYMRWMGLYWFLSFDSTDTGLLQGNLGRSMETMRPVSEMVGDRVLLTFLITLGTVLFTWALAIPIGIYSAVRQYSISDYILTFIGFIGMCVPGFLLALLLIYAGSQWFGITVTGLFSPEYATQPGWSVDKALDLLRHIWVPILVMGINGTAAMIRIMRANLLDELRKPYVTTARAKGKRPIPLLLKYPVRLALNPFVSGIGGLFPHLVSGGAIVAMVLSLPTVGPMMLAALFSEDTYLAGSMLLVLSLLGIVGTLVSDILLMWLDPRIRMEKA